MQLNAQHEMKYCAAWGSFALRRKSESTYCPLHTNNTTTEPACASGYKLPVCFIFLKIPDYLGFCQVTWGNVFFLLLWNYIEVVNVHNNTGRTYFIKASENFFPLFFLVQEDFCCLAITLCTKMDTVHEHHESSIIFLLH